MSRVLVAGINGFVGHHVADALSERDVEIIGTGNQPQVAQELGSLVSNYVDCDLTNPLDVRKIDLDNVDAIINLAGLAKVGESRGQAELYNRVNIGVHETLYKECLRQGVMPRIIAISTGAVYDPNQPMPITEDSLLVSDEKTNEYVISKKMAEEAIRKLKDQGLHFIIVRPFNHLGPGQLPGFLLPDLAEQMIQSKKSGQPLRVGNLKTRRDYTDVRDVARAYVDMALCDKSKLLYDTYNVCSGKSIVGEEILALLLQAYGIKEIKKEIDPTKLRPNEVMDIFGSHDRLTEAIGWQPKISIEQTIQDFATSQKQQP